MAEYIINAIQGGFNVVTGMGKPIVDMFKEVFLVTSSSGEVTGLTAIATFGLIFAGIGLITGLALRVIRKVM